MNNKNKSEIDNLYDNIFRFLNYWKLIVVSVTISLLIAFLYLRYANYNFKTTTIIEILDKAQDSDMALPSAMTIFNRSMINLDNETGKLKSFSINSRVISKLKSNVEYYSIGNIKTSQKHKSEFYNDYNIDFIIDTDQIKWPLTFF